MLLATYLAAVLAILSIAAAFWLLTRFDMRDAELSRCIQVAAYGATPALLCVAIALVAAVAASTLGGAGLGVLL